MSKFHKISRIAQFLGISAAGGYVGARSSSSSHESRDNAKSGAAAAVAVAAGAVGTAILGKILFRRIRGRIVPIRRKV